MMDREDIAGRALDALGPEETRRFDETADAATRAEVARMRAVAASLSDAVAVAPPADLRARVLAQIASTPQDAAGAVASDDDADAEPASADEPDRASREPVLVGGGAVAAGPRELAARRRWFQRPASMLAAAAAAAVLLVGGIAIGQSIRTPDAVSALVHAADVQTESAAMVDGSRATILWSAEQGDAAVMFDDLASLDEDQVYEAWFMREDGAVPAGIFDGSDGSAVHVLEGEMHDGDAIGITVEPAGGSESPTTDPLLVMST